MASALRTDPRCFRPLAPADPVVIELREWSRLAPGLGAEDLGAERNRLTNRFREQLWRYFPALLELENDLGTAWLLDLWEIAPTPAKAARIRETTIAELLERHRIRRFDAAHVLAGLRQPPVPSPPARPKPPAPTSPRSLPASARRTGASSTGSSNKRMIGSMP